MQALIDGDVLLYRCGFAARRNEYRAEDRFSGAVIGTWKTKTEAVCGLMQQKLTKAQVKLTKRVVPDPLKFALHTLRRQIDYIISTTHSDSYCLYLSPRDRSIFRYDVAVTVPYKGTRPLSKPVHFDAMREHLESEHPFKCVPNIEADDAMGIDQDKTGDSTIICSIDKDMWQIPGLHFDIRLGITQKISKAGFLELTKERKLIGGGMRWFWAQMLLGDACDNIKGINGLGNIKTYKLLEGKPLSEYKDIVREQYIKAFKDKAKDRFNENKQLLWILR